MGSAVTPLKVPRASLSTSQLMASLAQEEKTSKSLGKYGFIFLGSAIALGAAATLIGAVSILWAASAMLAALGCGAGARLCRNKQQASLIEISDLSKEITARTAPPVPGAPAPGPAMPESVPDAGAAFEAAIAQEISGGTADKISVRAPLQLTKRQENAA